MEEVYVIMIKVGDDTLLLSSQYGGVIIGIKDILKKLIKNRFSGKTEQSAKIWQDILKTFDISIIKLNCNPEEVGKYMIEASSYMQFIDNYIVPVKIPESDILEVSEENESLIEWNKLTALHFKQARLN